MNTLRSAESKRPESCCKVTLFTVRAAGPLALSSDSFKRQNNEKQSSKKNRRNRRNTREAYEVLTHHGSTALGPLDLLVQRLEHNRFLRFPSSFVPRYRPLLP